MWCYKYSFASWWFSIICGGLLGRLKTPLGVLSVFLHLVSLRLVFILTPATSQMMHSVGCGWKVSATTVSFGRSLSCVNAKTGRWEMELLLDFLNRLCDIRVRFSSVRHHIHFTVCPQQPLTGWRCSAALKRLSLFTTLNSSESLLCWPLNTYSLNCVVIARLPECMSLISSLCLSWLVVNIALPDQ